MASYLDQERDVICVCGSQNKPEAMRLMKHASGDVVMLLDRCQWCNTQSLCGGSQRGIHGEVLTADEEDYRPESLQIEGIVVEPPNTDRFGYCRACGQGCYFDPAMHRWRDLTWVDVAEEWANPPVPPSVAQSDHGA